MVSRGDYQTIDDTDEQFSTEIHTKITWDHIQNLDKFFSNVYYFHQQHGFYVTFIEFILQVLKFFFIIWILSVFFELCFNRFNIVDKDYVVNFTYFYNPIILRSDYAFTKALVVLSFFMLLIFIISKIPKLHQFYSVSKFYRDALKIADDAIPDKTWSEVMKQLIEVQKELQLCVHKPMLTELDIYHRILRRQNYLIAMLNQEKEKDAFPTEINIPLYGTFVIVTKYYLDSIKFMLFKFPFKCPFGDHWQLRSEYKNLGNRKELISQIQRLCLVMGFCQLLISPFCFVYLLITKACTYGHSFKINPSFCINREITPYGRIFLAHFNELPHEFAYRISKAYTPVNEYLDSFISKIIVSLARLLRFLSGGIIVIGFLISLVQNKFLLAPHIITIAAVVTLVYSVSSKLITDETNVVNPKLLMMEILTHVHYVPDYWKDWAHTRKVYYEIAKLFQPKLIGILNELFSCFWTPLIFIFFIPKYAAKIVDFLRNYTTDMHGVGDICSFAQMDVRKHGSALWATSASEYMVNGTRSEAMKHGKVELSLVNFHTNNPNCPLEEKSQKFINDLKSISHETIPPIGAVQAVQHSLNPHFSIFWNGEQTTPYLKNASKVVGPVAVVQQQQAPTINYGGNAFSNYFHNHNVTSMYLSQNSIAFDCYRSHHESMKDAPRTDFNMSIYVLHGIHEKRRWGQTVKHLSQTISEAEEDQPHSGTIETTP